MRNGSAKSTHDFVILDDQHAAQFQAEGLGSKLVTTILQHDDDPSLEGLTTAKADEAIAILGDQEFVRWMNRHKQELGNHLLERIHNNNSTLPQAHASGLGVQFEV